MELKINYQYTYFIHPFVVKESKYQKYMLRLLKDKNCFLKRFEKEKDLKLYQFFNPKTREFLFSSFSFTNAKYAKFEELPIETRAGVLAKYPCSIFEYRFDKDIQGKTEINHGIFFHIQKIDIICFSTGICFLCLKTNMEDTQSFEDLLNFNYKFRDINQESNQLNGYDNIRIQTNNFASADDFLDFIHKITGSSVEAMKLDIDTERFLTYSYVCVDQEAWNHNEQFESIEHNFIKYANILPADTVANLKKEDTVAFSRWKYAKMGMTKQGVVLMTSSHDMNNYTILPEEYENAYLYTYILALYEKLYLKKLSLEFKDISKMKNARKKFINFSKKMWITEITDDESGTMLYHKLKEVLELDELYYKVKGEYDIYYKELNIEKNRTMTIGIAIVLVASLIFNILNFMALMDK